MTRPLQALGLDLSEDELVVLANRLRMAGRLGQTTRPAGTRALATTDASLVSQAGLKGAAKPG